MFYNMFFDDIFLRNSPYLCASSRKGSMWVVPMPAIGCRKWAGFFSAGSGASVLLPFFIPFPFLKICPFLYCSFHLAPAGQSFRKTQFYVLSRVHFCVRLVSTILPRSCAHRKRHVFRWGAKYSLRCPC